MNAAWEVLRDPAKKTAYNQKIVAAAMDAEATSRKKSAFSQLAQRQKANASAAAARRKTTVKQPKPCTDASKGNPKEAQEKGTGGKPGSKAASSSSSKEPAKAASASSKDPSDNWVYCKLVKQKAAVVCKSLLTKQLQRKFEHKAWAGEANAIAVAMQFQTACEKMITTVLGLNKLEQLKVFCADQCIEVPNGVRLTKGLLQDTLEEASVDQQVPLE